MTKTVKPDVMVQLDEGRQRLSPVTSYDAECLTEYSMQSVFVLKPLPKRSGALHRTYWKMLTEVVKATHVKPTAEKLHDALMWSLGMLTVEEDLEGVPHLVRDSIAFAEMPTDAEFKPYFDMAVEYLAKHLGVDPLDFLKEAR